MHNTNKGVARATRSIPAQKEHILRLHRAGVSIAAIMIRTGASSSATYKVIREAKQLEAAKA